MYDFLIIGAGVGGCNVAYFLQKSGKKVAIIDKEKVAGGASGVAGAFLSPLPGKKNSYNSFVNNSLKFAMNFYEELNPKTVYNRGILRIPNENFNISKLKDNAIEYQFFDKKKLQNISKNFNDIDGYFYKDATLINPFGICEQLINGCDFYKKDVKELKFLDGVYQIDNLRTKNIILATGVGKPLMEYPYLKILPMFGLRIDVKTSTKVPFNIHKSISISATNNGIVAIGATKQRHNGDVECVTNCQNCIFYIDSEKEQINHLLKEASELIKLENLEVVKSYMGARATIKSYFPVIGKIVDYKKSLEKYPSIKNGTKIPLNLLTYFPNLHIINGLGSRGFVFAPYLAKILSENIINQTPIPDEISTQKLFYKMARKKIS